MAGPSDETNSGRQNLVDEKIKGTGSPSPRGKKNEKEKWALSLKCIAERPGKEDGAGRTFLIRLDHFPDAIALVDGKTGNLMMGNNALCEMLGYTENEILSLNVLDLYPEASLALLRESYARVKRGRAEIIDELPASCKDGSRIYTEIHPTLLEPGDSEYIMIIVRDVTSRRETRLALEESETKFRDLTEKSMGGVYLIQDGIFKYVNPRFAEIFGYTTAELIDKLGPRDIARPDNWPGVQEKIRQRIAGEVEALHYDFVGQTKSKRSIHVEVYGSRTIYRGKAAVIGTLLDVTEQRNAEADLRESRARLQTIFDNIPFDFWVCDQDGRYLIQNTVSIRNWGNQIGKLPKETGAPPEVLSIWQKNNRRALDGEIVRSEVKYGESGYFQSIVAPISQAPGETMGILGINIDITQQKQAIEALRKSEQRFRTFLEQSSEGIFLLEFNPAVSGRLPLDEQIKRSLESGFIGECNDVFARMSGSPGKDSVMGKCLKDIFEDRKFRLYAGEFEQFVRNGYRLEDLEVSQVDGQGEEVAFVYNAVGVVRDGHLTAVWGTQKDITDQRKVEKEIRMLAQALKSISEMVGVTDLEDRFIFVNDAFCEAYGYTREEMIGQSVGLVRSVHNSPEVLSEILPSTLRGGWRGEILNKRKDGSEFVVSLYTSPLRNEKNEPVAMIGVSRDVSEQRQLEEQLRQAQKMESIGTLAGGIAHDFNNLLTVINGYSDLAMKRIEPDHYLYNFLHSIRKAGERAHELTRQLLAFSRKQMFRPKILDINKTIADLNKMMLRLIGEDIHIETDLKSGLPAVKADPSQIEQILLNLVVNARDAVNQKVNSTEEKRIVIKTDAQEIDAAFAATMPGCTPGTHVLLTVEDNGQGMSEIMKEKIFEPFFTTKETGKGTGLGLSTVYGIVRQNKGCVKVDSQSGEGSTFTIYWPASDEAPTDTGQEEAKPQAARGRETILLVEDDESVREFTADALREHGYHIISASDGPEAIRQLQQSGRTIDLLLTDMVMPRMNGKELADQIIRIQPGIRVLFASGYTDVQLFDADSIRKGIQFIQKPFSISSLLEKIRTILGN